MAKIEYSITADVPLSTAYNQWTQFEDFPSFMEGIRKVTQIDDTHLRFQAEIGGMEKEWVARITEQNPDERVAWTSTGGAHNAGVVTFHRLSDNQTRIMLQMEYDPQGFLEGVGDAFGVVSARVKGDLQRFKEFIESRGCETGGWRGTVHEEHGMPGGRHA